MTKLQQLNEPSNNPHKSFALPNKQSNHAHPLIRDLCAACDGLSRTVNGRRKRRHRRDVYGQWQSREAPRRERTEAIRELLKTLCEGLDLRTGRIIDVRNNDGYGGMRNRWAASKSGLTVERHRGALADLTTMGYVGSFQPRATDENGAKTGLPSVRWVSEKFWRGLGAWEVWKSYKNEIKIAAGTKRPPTKAAEKHATIQARKHAASSAAADALAVKRGRLQFAVAKEYPAFTVAEVEAEAERRLQL